MTFRALEVDETALLLQSVSAILGQTINMVNKDLQTCTT